MAHEPTFAPSRLSDASSFSLPSTSTSCSPSPSQAQSVSSRLTSKFDHHQPHHLEEMKKFLLHDNLACTSLQSQSTASEEEMKRTIGRGTAMSCSLVVPQPSSAIKLTNLMCASSSPSSPTANGTCIDRKEKSVARTAAKSEYKLSSSTGLIIPAGGSNSEQVQHHHYRQAAHYHPKPHQQWYVSAVRTTLHLCSLSTAAFLMQPSALSAAALSPDTNHSTHLHHHHLLPPSLPLLNQSTGKEWPYSWPVTHILRDSTLVPSTTFNYLSLFLLVVSLALNLYLTLLIIFGRSQRIKTHSLMKHIFISNLLLVFSVLPFEVMKYLSKNHSLAILPTAHLVCKVLSSVQVITE